MYKLNEKLLRWLGPLSSHCLRIFEKRAEQIDSGIHQENFYYREIFTLKHENFSFEYHSQGLIDLWILSLGLAQLLNKDF